MLALKWVLAVYTVKSQGNDSFLPYSLRMHLWKDATSAVNGTGGSAGHRGQ